MDPLSPAHIPNISLKRPPDGENEPPDRPAKSATFGRDFFKLSDPHIGLGVFPHRDDKAFPVQVPLFQLDAGDIKGELSQIPGQTAGAVTLGYSKGPADSRLNLDGQFLQIRHRFQKLDLQGPNGALMASGRRTEIRLGVEGIEPELAYEKGKVSLSGFNLEQGWARDNLEQFAKDHPWGAAGAGLAAAGATIGVLHAVAKESKTPIRLPIAVDFLHQGPLTLGAKPHFYFPGDDRVVRLTGFEGRMQYRFERARLRASAGYVQDEQAKGFSGRLTAEVPVPNGFVGVYAGHDPASGVQVGAGLSLTF